MKQARIGASVSPNATLSEEKCCGVGLCGLIPRPSLSEDHAAFPDKRLRVSSRPRTGRELRMGSDSDAYTQLFIRRLLTMICPTTSIMNRSTGANAPGNSGIAGTLGFGFTFSLKMASA